MRARLLFASLVGVLMASAVALPCWTTFLQPTVGRLLTVEQIHLLQYAGLGAVAGFYFQATARTGRVVMELSGLLVGVGLGDELMQQLLPQRVFQWSDVGLNWTGSLLGFWLFHGMARLLRRFRRG